MISTRFTYVLWLNALSMITACSGDNKGKKYIQKDDIPGSDTGDFIEDVPEIEAEDCPTEILINPHEGLPDLCVATEQHTASTLRFSDYPMRMAAFKDQGWPMLAVSFYNNARTGDDVKLYEFDGDQFNESQSLQIVPGIQGIAAGDYDADGDQDLAFAGSGGVFVYKNNSGSFDRAWSSSSSDFVGSQGIESIELADGSVGFAVSTDNGTRLLVPQSSGDFVNESVARGMGLGSTDDNIDGAYLAVCDVNNDGLDDVIVPNASRGDQPHIPNPVYVQSASGNFSEQSEALGLFPDHDYSAAEAACAYEEGFGKSVVYMANAASSTGGSAANDYFVPAGAGYQEVAADQRVIDNGNSWSAELIELNPDFPNALAVGRLGDSSIGLQFYVADGERFKEATTGYLSPLSGGVAADIETIDLMGSSAQDILILDGSNQELLVYENQSQPVAE